MAKNEGDEPTAVVGEVDNVKVVVRSRPLTESELIDGHSSAVQVNRALKSISVVNLAAKNEPSKCFTFDEVFDNTCDQIMIYNAVARPIVENVLCGYNGTIFAYGQTGTGKTYTMSGNDDVAEERGIIPNSFAHIFDHIAKCNHEKTFLVRVSFLEIYNEDVHDLLLRPHKTGSWVMPPPLEVKERADIGVYVKDLSNVTVCSADHMFKLLQFGNENRHTGATSMNERSSRSHALFTVTIECSEVINGRKHLTQGKLHLVDLAGSERQSKTNAVGDRLKEASKINLSLSNLGNVISALVDAKSTHVPYRNSKLTRLLQDSLGGNSKTVMIANIGPASYNYDETISTLRYANRAKSIKNVTHINEDPKDALLRKFQEEIETLRKQLENEELMDDGVISGSEDVEDGGTYSNQREANLKVADQHFFERIADMEREMAAKRERLAAEKGMVEAERRKLVDDLQRKEAELEASKREHDNLMAKLTAIERKLIIGGENMLEKAEKQAHLLEQSNFELERARQSEQEMNERLASGEAERLDIEEKYSSLQEEAIGKTRKLKKIWNHYAQAKAELKDVEAEHQREMEALLENVRQLQKELALATVITDAYIPEEYARLIERNVYWNEEIGDWQLRCIAYTGNNMRGNLTGVSGSRNGRQIAAFQKILAEPQLKPIFHSYADVLGGSATSGLMNSFSSTASSVGSSPFGGGAINQSMINNISRAGRPPKFRPRSAMKDRNAARIKALLD